MTILVIINLKLKTHFVVKVSLPYLLYNLGDYFISKENIMPALPLTKIYLIIVIEKATLFGFK